MSPRKRTRKAGKTFDLRLFVAGTAAFSTMAVTRVKDFCERFLKDRYRLRVIDLYQQPELAAALQIIATPTLIRFLPVPKKVLVGQMIEPDRFLKALEIPAGESA